jgi:hypothetical protein
MNSSQIWRPGSKNSIGVNLAWFYSLFAATSYEGRGSDSVRD